MSPHDKGIPPAGADRNVSPPATPAAPQRSKPRRFLIESAAVLVIVGSCTGLLWWPLLSSDVKPWEQGDYVPTEPPEESRRVTVPQAFSIVAPVRWDHRQSQKQTDEFGRFAHLVLSPRRSIPARNASINVILDEPTVPETSELQPTEFQGRPAWFDIEIRPGTLDDAGHFRYTLVFERGGGWYRLGYICPHDDLTELPPTVWSYFETFRLEAPLPDGADPP